MLSSEYRGHQLVEKRSPRGHTVYKVPEKLAQELISEIIRAVDREGWTLALNLARSPGSATSMSATCSSGTGR